MKNVILPNKNSYLDVKIINDKFRSLRYQNPELLIHNLIKIASPREKKIGGIKKEIFNPSVPTLDQHPPQHPRLDHLSIMSSYLATVA